MGIAMARPRRAWAWPWRGRGVAGALHGHGRGTVAASLGQRAHAERLYERACKYYPRDAELPLQWGKMCAAEAALLWRQGMLLPPAVVLLLLLWTGILLVLRPGWMFRSACTAGARGCRPPASWGRRCGCVHTSPGNS